MRELVREEDTAGTLEGDRVVAPDQRRERQRLVEDREVRRAVAARQIVLGQRQREARVRRLADQADRRTRGSRPTDRRGCAPREDCRGLACTVSSTVGGGGDPACRRRPSPVTSRVATRVNRLMTHDR